MSAAAFAYALILHGAKAENELMMLLSQERGTEVQAVLESVRGISPENVRAQLKQLREDQLNRQREAIVSQMGLDLERVSPKLQAWLTRPF